MKRCKCGRFVDKHHSQCFWCYYIACVEWGRGFEAGIRVCEKLRREGIDENYYRKYIDSKESQ